MKYILIFHHFENNYHEYFDKKIIPSSKPILKRYKVFLGYQIGLEVDSKQYESNLKIQKEIISKL